MSEDLRLPDLAVVAGVAIVERSQAKGETLEETRAWFERLVRAEVEKIDRHEHARTEAARMIDSPGLTPAMLERGDGGELVAEGAAAAERIKEGLRAGLDATERRAG